MVADRDSRDDELTALDRIRRHRRLVMEYRVLTNRDKIARRPQDVDFAANVDAGSDGAAA